jgi:maltoporin
MHLPTSSLIKGKSISGIHGTPLVLTQGVTTTDQATLAFDSNYQGVTMTANLKPGTGSDSIVVGSDFVQVTSGGFQFFVPVAGFQQVGSQWVYSGSGAVSAATLASQADGSVTVALQANGLALQATLSTNTSIGVQIGDDFALTLINFRGMLQYL